MEQTSSFLSVCWGQRGHFKRFFWGGCMALNALYLDPPLLHYKMLAGEDCKEICFGAFGQEWDMMRGLGE